MTQLLIAHIVAAVLLVVTLTIGAVVIYKLLHKKSTSTTSIYDTSMTKYQDKY